MASRQQVRLPRVVNLAGGAASLGSRLEPLAGAPGRVRSRPGGVEAIEYLRAHPQEPSVMLLDLMLPRLDGQGVLETMAAEGITVPVIVVTASRNPTVPAGVRLLQKPIATVALAAAICEVCG